MKRIIIVISICLHCSLLFSQTKVYDDHKFHFYDANNQEKISGWVITTKHNEFLLSDEVRSRIGDLTSYDSLRIYKFGYQVMDISTDQLEDTIYFKTLAQSIAPVEIGAKRLKKKRLCKKGSFLKPRFTFTPYNSTVFQVSILPRQTDYLLKSVILPLTLDSCTVGNQRVNIVSDSQVLTELILDSVDDELHILNDINLEVGKLKRVEIYTQLEIHNPGNCRLGFNIVGNRGPTQSAIHAGSAMKERHFPHCVIIKE